jgi:osmotically-inducible protein OsmY
MGLAVVACTPLSAVTTAGAMAATAAQEERGLDGATRDTVIRATIAKNWLDHDAALLTGVNLTVLERRVLLTGALDDATLVDAAVRLAWQADGVVEVINELRVNPDRGLGDRTRDALISSELSRTLLFDSGIKSINYAVDVVERTVYVMGVAQNQAELDRVLSWARNTDYVRRVVSHVHLKTDPARVGPRGEGQ